eukprot:CAMPEP_0198113496 /NCGR_PEP_ID=MMETSP1442-20131203/5154_1 /TAXON_ID= /ORGANISM="Craspedostauros australis, Strain CCMP3328" /LENGTH=60 /DNA_ID=CAMNT_0043770609 /DNA_START=91 /DNA_END=273 /DNA_ORIENTATION=+
MAKEEEWTPVEYAINGGKILFAISPLLVLAYVLLSAFESDEDEAARRKKHSDFKLEGHGE